MQPEIYSVMYRLVHKYGWNWGLTRGLINRRFGTNYTADELKELNQLTVRKTAFYSSDGIYYRKRAIYFYFLWE